ncbi:Structural maintenance of chromosome0s protein 5 [Vanrija pseudolonga]|uniref:Structural maintenance of chromosomes protein 5 n=1 Tax=Vanrija pseudolonga TaxID=143232 RepID=A0AAF0Y4U9_9TREE|nr:Structural maintenance of chromosome0s protein 5 [Vanrija pseudolonga]
MPPPRASTRNKRRVVDSGDESSDGAESPQRPTRNNNNNKRARLDAEEDDQDDVVDLISADEDVKPRIRNKGKQRAAASDEEDEEDDEEDEDEGEADAQANGNGGPPSLLMQRDEDGFVPGAIVRIKIRNFMTYDFVEFNPGPKLNMILGPNGTGKSSIAAAIVIGLGFPPKTMGRAQDLKSYVKQGTEVAETEIELKGPIGKPNLVIWRRFSRDNDKSEFKLNGKAVTRKTIDKLVASFDVQATNLCTFLPQDKVSDFAKMNPEFVLKETMLAAGDSRMTEWHEKLITRGGEAKDVDSALAVNMQKRNQLQTQVDALAPDVRSYEQRKELEFERDVLQCLVIAAEAFRLNDVTVAAKEKKQKARQKHDAAGDKQAQFKDLVKSQKRRQEKLVDDVEKERVRLDNTRREVRKAKDDCKAAERQSKELEEKLRSIGSEARKREQEKQRLEARITEQQAILDSPQADVTGRLELLDKQKKELLAKVRPLEVKRDEAIAKHRQFTRDMTQIQKDIADAEAQKQRLSSIELKRKQAAFKFDPSIQYVCQWLEKNEDKLKAKVCLPPMISASVPDQRYAWMVEACTSANQRKASTALTFICQTEEDYRTLLSLNGTMFNPEPGKTVKVGIHLATVNVTQESANPQRPCSQERLRDLGFDGWAIDFVEADAPVVAYLCEYAKMHRSALTQRDGTRIASDTVAEAGITSWVTRTDSNRATRSHYGTRAFQITSNPPRLAVAFNMAVDVESINRISEDVAKLRRQQHEIEKPAAKARVDADQYTTDTADLRGELADVKQNMEKLQREAQKYTRARIEIGSSLIVLDMAQSKLDELKNKPSPEVTKNKIQKALLEQVEDRKKGYAKLQRACLQSDTDIDNLFKATFEVTKVSANLRELQTVEKIIGDKFDAAFQALDEATAVYRHAKNKQERTSAEFIDKSDEQPPNVRREIRRRCDDRDLVARSKTDLMTVETDLDLAVGVTEDVIDRHRRLSAELKEREATVKEQQAQLARLQQEVNTILAKLNPALDALVTSVSTRFSNAFQALGCAGEVQMDRVEGDHSKWGIKILVSYREDQDLEVLTASRQSGGERSLATVTYLMSLGEMSRTPFSLVDEINQGMDARAERAVHNLMVKVSCSEAAGQYFLITPKLLTDLNYHRDMKVLVVNNGVGIPDPSNKARRFGQLAASLDRYKRDHGITA